jgi:hypothetical protein
MKRTIEERLLNPKPESKVEAAKEFGIDLTLLIGTLRLTPNQRVKNMQKAMISLEKFSNDAKLWRKNNSDKLKSCTRISN